MNQKKRIYIIYTGGTIGMQETPEGYKPYPGLLTKLLESMPELKHKDSPTYTLHEYDPLIDSADATPTLWTTIGKDIMDHYAAYDGFIVLHGTDTMAYTASALSFMFEHLSKPIIVTGSQVPMANFTTDARENVINALYIASHYNIPEVCLLFNNKLLRGNRAKKISATSYTAFESPNFVPLGEVASTIKIRQKKLLPPATANTRLQKIHPVTIGSISLFPGMSLKFIRSLLNKPLQALVIETYGSGNAPADNELHRILQQANAQDIIVVNCTQCLHGRVKMQSYATGNALIDAGVISANDMTIEATICKLYYLFSCQLTIAQIRQRMQQNLRGELSPPQL